MFVPDPPRRRWRRLRTVLGMLSPWRARAIAGRFGYADYTPPPADLVLVEDIYLLPLAFRVPGKPRVVMDAREYFPRVHEASVRFRLFQARELRWLCREFLPLCDAVITVSDGLAREFRAEFGIECSVVRSVPEATDLPVTEIDPRIIRLVHHGVANRDRQIEKLLAIGRALGPGFTLDLYLTGDPTYIAELDAQTTERVRILPPVPFERIIPTLNDYDIGLFYVEPTTFNLRHCLPNKLFEFIHARLAVAIGPSPDMTALVREHGCGVVADSFTVDGMVGALRALEPATIMEYKRASDRAARILNWNVERGNAMTLVLGAAGT